jgi:hypothetical protein
MFNFVSEQKFPELKAQHLTVKLFHNTAKVTCSSLTFIMVQTKLSQGSHGMKATSQNKLE